MRTTTTTEKKQSSGNPPVMSSHLQRFLSLNLCAAEETILSHLSLLNNICVLKAQSGRTTSMGWIMGATLLHQQKNLLADLLLQNLGVAGVLRHDHNQGTHGSNDGIVNYELGAQLKS